MQPFADQLVFRSNNSIMRGIIILWLLILVSFAGFGQGAVRDVGSFSGIKAGEGLDVYLKKGDRESVRVEPGSDTDADQIITEVSGSFLKIHVRDGMRVKNVYAKVFVTYKSLDKIWASSAANIYTEGVLSADELEVGCSSAATVDLEISVSDLEVEVSSAGDVELEGRATRASINASSAGQIDAYDLQVDVLDVEVNSAGSAKVSVVKELNAEASSGGNVRYRGNPSKSRTDSNSGGSVKKSY